MPGMMETVLNIGLSPVTIQGLIKSTNNPKFVYDSYRRLIMMYADVVMEKTNDKCKNINIRLKLEHLLNDLKKKLNYKNDSDLKREDLQIICDLFKQEILKKIKYSFPEDPIDQLWGSIEAVFKSWNGTRAINYRNIENIPHSWGTAVNIQCMVFGNMGENSATGVGFTRNPATGEKRFFGEWLINAQGEDVVAGIRTPYYIDGNLKTDLKIQMPAIYKKLNSIQKILEQHYKEMQDIEFTIEKNKLWILQTRTGKRNGIAAIKIALDMYKEKILNLPTMLAKIEARHINEILHSTINYKKTLKPIAVGLPAGPGAACGVVVFNPSDAEKYFNNGKSVILVREETSPEDVQGMFLSEAILTSRGGMTSHAALVARGWGKCCIVGCNAITINKTKKYFKVGNIKIYQDDWITLNGSNGHVYIGQLPLIKPKVNKNILFNNFLSAVKKNSDLSVRANADSSKDAETAISLGATGIGLCRTEHMFFKAERIIEMRKMIIANNNQDRNKALRKILPFQKNDFYKLLKSMNNMPVTIRLLDPPLHEFLPQGKNEIAELAKDLKITNKKLSEIIDSLHEANPMLGHRGCRLGITYPEITTIQTTAIIKASQKLQKEGFQPKPEIMIPLVGNLGEFVHQKNIVVNTIKKLNADYLNIKIGTMIELPRACFIADKIAKYADFISFGTNDLTQTTFGFSRDDIGSFMPKYIAHNIIESDPFEILDIKGVGELIKLAVNKAKKTNKNIKIGICGEHGGNPESIKFLHHIGVHYVSCSPYRVPIAYLTLAQISSIK